MPSTTICVYGLWHLGCVTASMAAEGFDVVGLDTDEELANGLVHGAPPISDSGLAELIQEQMASGRWRFTTDPDSGLRDVDVLLVAFDTPVNDDDVADVDWLSNQLEAVRSAVRAHSLVLITSQVPVGLSRRIEREWQSSDPTLSFAYSPENVRLGQAIQGFRVPGRVVVGLSERVPRERLQRVFEPFTDTTVWMSLESAEMTKHAINAFLAMSVLYANELGRRVCEQVGADAREVERGLRSEPRIGERPYVSAGPAIAGGTLTRDVAFLQSWQVVIISRLQCSTRSVKAMPCTICGRSVISHGC